MSNLYNDPIFLKAVNNLTEYEWEKIKFTLWDYYYFVDSLSKYFGKEIEYDYWRQVYSDYLFARQYLKKFNLDGIY